jgi:hypothetical protein
MTAHPEVPGSPGEFQPCPDWVPTMDSGQRFARITLKTMPVHRFDHSASWPAKVRNVSYLGEPNFNSRISRYLIDFIACL